MLSRKRKNLVLTIAALAGFSLTAPHSANAATYYWDNNGTTAGFGTAGSTWADPTIGSATLGWSTDGTGVTLPGTVSTLTTDTLNFGNGATGLAAGTITVSGTVNAGNLNFASGSGAITLSTGTINLDAAATVTVDNTTDTISAILSGAATSLTKAGTGTLVLSGVNTYTGATNINAGTLTISDAGTFTNTSAINLAGTARLNVNAVNADLTKLTSVPAGTFLRYSQAQTAGVALTGSILGTVELNVTNVNPGYTLDFGTGSKLTNLVNATFTSAITLSGNATIDSAAVVFTGTGMNVSASTAGTKTLTLTGTSTGANVISGSISDGAGVIGVNKDGAGTWNLSGANSYTGATNINAGTLTISDAGTYTSTSAINLAGTARLNVNAANADLTKLTSVPAGTFLRYSTAQGGGVAPTGSILGTVELNVTNVNPGYTLDFGTGSKLTNLVNATFTSAITLSGNATIDSAAVVFTGTGMNVSASTAGTKTLTLTGTGTGANIIGGSISDGSGVINVSKTGAGSWTIATPSYTGTTAITAGSLQFNSLPAAADRTVTVSAGATVAAGYAMDNLFLNKIAENSNAFNIQMAVASANDLDLSSSTGANLPNAVLNGAGNTAYTGNLTPNGTTYRIGNLSGAAGAGWSNALTFNMSKLTGAANSVVVSGTGLVIINSTSDYKGTTTVSAGSSFRFDGAIDNIGTIGTRDITINAGGAIARTGGLVNNAFLNRLVENSNAITIYMGNAANSNNLDFSSSTGANLPNASLAFYDSAGTQTFTYTGTITPNSNVYRFGGSRAGNNINLPNLNALTGARSVVVNGGNLRLLNSNDFTGGVTINAGTFTIASPVAGMNFAAGQGQIGGGNYAGAILNNATLAHTSNLDQTLSGIISGTGAVTKTFTSSTGGGTVLHGTTSTLTLTNTNTYTGATNVQAGNLAVGSNAPSGAAGALGNATSDVSMGVASGLNNAGLLISGAFTVGRNIRNLTANATDAGTRVITLGGNTAANSVFSGGIFLGTANQTSRGVSLTAASGGQVTFSGVIQDPTGQDASELANAASITAVTKVGTGTVVLSGANTFLGGTEAKAGTLTLEYGTQNNSKLADLAPLTFSGGTINLSGGSHPEVVGSTTINPGASAVTRSSGTSKLALGSITANAGGSIDFGASSIATTTNSNDSSGILGFYATVAGKDWAANDGSGNIVAYTGYADVNARGPSTIADAANSNVRILGNGTSGNITLGAPTTTINSLVQQNASFAATVDTTGGTLALSAILLGTGQEALTIGTAPGSGTLNAAIPNGELLLINNNTGKDLTVNSSIADNSSSRLTKMGAGTVILNGTNAYNGVTTINAGTLVINGLNTTSGGTTLNSGKLVLGNAGALGGSTLTINGGVIEATGTIVTANSVNANADFSVVGTGSLTLADTTMSVPLTITNSTTAGVTTFGGFNGTNTALTFAGIGNTNVNGIIGTGTGTLTQAGTGVVTLLGDNSYTGVTNITAGTLNLAGNRTGTMSGINVGNATGNAVLGISADVPMGGNVITVGGGTGIGGLGTVNQTAGNVVFTSGTQLLVGNVSMNGIYNLSGGTLTTAGVANRGIILGVNTGRTGTFNLSGTGSLLMDAASVLQLGRSENTTATATTGIFTQTGGTATVGDLRIGGSTANAVGTANANGTLSISAGTFAASTFSQLAGSNNSVATINISGTADVTLPAFPTARGTGSTATITFNGGTLKNAAASATYMGGLTNAFIKAGGAKFDTTNGDITITQALLTDLVSLGGGLTKDGTNTLTITGTNTYTGTTTVSAGTLQVGDGGATGSVGSGPVVNNAIFVVNRTGTLTTGTIDGTGATTVTATGANLTAGRLRQTTLDIGANNTVTVAANGGDSGTSTLTNLSIDATGKLDLTNNDLIVDNGNLTTLTAKLASGLDITGSYGSGPGINGITSSTFANDPNFNTVLGIASNADLGYATFSGQTIDANDVLIKYTYFGDADLNGVVDGATDFDLYITGLTSGGSLGGWLYGDFDYNGTVDSATDFDLYITGLSSQGGPLLTGGGSNLVQAVPEPSTLVLAGLGVLGFAGVQLRRRRLAVQQ